MYVIQIEDVADILKSYSCESNLLGIDLIEYYYLDDSVCMVVLAKTVSEKKYIIKIISKRMICFEEEEQQSCFSEFLREKGISTPQKHKNKGQFGTLIKYYNNTFLVTVEDYFGVDIKSATQRSSYALGSILAKMHLHSQMHDYHMKNGTTYNALFKEKVNLRTIWGANNGSVISKTDYEQIDSIHSEQMLRLKKIWGNLPKGSVHGDLGLTSNFMLYGNKYGVIDFNLSGDEIFLNDMLVTWYSSRYNYDIATSFSLDEIYKLRQSFFDGYLSNRQLCCAELKNLKKMSYIINGVYFNRFVANVVKNNSDSIKQTLVPMIKQNYYQSETDYDLKELFYSY